MMLKAFVFAALVCLARGQIDVPDGGPEVKVEDDVLVLNKDNFDFVVSNNKHVLVEFYAPWCGHCKALAPQYSDAAGRLKGDSDEVVSSIKLAKVDATVESDLGSKYEVRGYPTLKFFKDGKPMEFGGGRTAEDIVNWLKKKTGPPAKELKSDEDFAKVKEANPVVVVGHFSDPASDAAKKYLEVADTIDDVVFTYIYDAGVASRASIATNEVAVFKQFDEGRADYTGDVTDAAELTQFVKGNQLALVTEFTSESAPKIFGGEIQIHNLLFISKTSSEFEKTIDDFKHAAAQFKGKVLFIFVDADTEDNQRVMEFFGLSKEDVPDYRIIKMSENMAKFKPETKDLSSDAIAAFTTQVLTGELKRHLMSAEIPDDWNKNPVTVLVGKNFKEVAFDKSKKVFVEFYAPWCGHCKSLAPTWEKLGEKFSSDSDVVIAKMDATANEVEEFEIGGFPTLKFFPSGSDKIMDYDGDRTLDAMSEFVESNGEKGGVPKDGKPPPKEYGPPPSEGGGPSSPQGMKEPRIPTEQEIQRQMMSELGDLLPKEDPKETVAKIQQEHMARKVKEAAQGKEQPKHGGEL